MIVLLSSLGFLVVILLVVMSIVPGRIAFPRVYNLQAVPLTGLTDREVATIGEWSRELEALGFERGGEYSIRINHGSASTYQQVEQYRTWLSSDGATWAYVKHEAFLDHTGMGAARSRIHLGFQSRSEEGVNYRTHNSSVDDAFGRDPSNLCRRFQELQNPAALLQSHRDRGLSPSPLKVWGSQDYPSFARDQWESKARWMGDHGYLRLDGDLYRLTPKTALLTTLYGWNPFRAETGSRWKLGFRLIVSVAAMVGLAALTKRFASPDHLELSLCGLSLVWGLVGPILFPRLSFFSWFYAVLPAYLYLELKEGYRGWSWAPGFVIAVMVGSGMERWRYRRANHRLEGSGAVKSKPMSPVGRIGSGVALLFSAIASVGMHRVVRAPMPDGSDQKLLVVAYLLGSIVFIAMFGLWSILSLAPAARKWRIYPALRSAGWCGFLLILGLGSGFYFEQADRDLSAVRAASIQSALEEYRQTQGHYPKSLDDLVPKYLASVPIPKVGFSEARFTYASHAFGGREGYGLGYCSFFGDRYFGHFTAKALSPDDDDK